MPHLSTLYQLSHLSTLYLLSHISTLYQLSHLSTLYQLAKTEWRPFQDSRDDSQLALSQLNSSEGIYGYQASNLDNKNKIYIFLLAFFLLYIIWIPVSASKLLYFIHIILTQITENTKNVDIDIYIEIAWTFSLTILQNGYTERTGDVWFI